MKENKMGVMPIGKLIITMSLPIMISMLVQALYNGVTIVATVPIVIVYPFLQKYFIGGMTLGSVKD